MRLNTRCALLLGAAALMGSGCREHDRAQLAWAHGALEARFGLPAGAQFAIIDRVGVERWDCTSDCILWEVARAGDSPVKLPLESRSLQLTYGAPIEGTQVVKAAETLTAGHYRWVTQLGLLMEGDDSVARLYAERFELKARPDGGYEVSVNP